VSEVNVSLREYHRKRHFDRTPEPRGGGDAPPGRLRFVVQKHAASRLHYDFRLELDGALKSWAVPKGPSLNPADKRLAVRVEDHPLDYRTFEGSIPAGNYGAGDVIVWDEGSYAAAESRPGRDDEPTLRAGLERGRLSVVLHGHKLHGEFSLVRLNGKGKFDKNWLLIKKHDRWATEDDVTADGRSVMTGKNLPGEETIRPVKRASRAAGARTGRATGKKGERFVKPMLASLIDEPFDRDGWFFEVKWDGYRAIAEVDRRGVRLYSRNQLPFNDAFPSVVDELRRLKHAATLDGEVVALDEAGRSSFQLLQNYRKTGKGRLAYYVFDLLELDGRDLRGEPLRTRRRLLAPLLTGLRSVALSEAVEDRGVAFFRAATAHGLEGVVAKDGDSPYREGARGADWVKVKARNRQEAVVGGFTAPRGSRTHLGALVLGVYEGKELVYIGHTGGGSGRKQLADLRTRLDPLVRKTCPFRTTPRVNAPVTWVEPELVCEVEFQEWTADGRMRQPIFAGLREDKSATSVRREVPSPVPEHDGGGVDSPSPHGPTLTNLEKVYWPVEGYTKGDLLDYYREVAPVLLPYLRDRPLSLLRQPDGIAGKSFFQKDVSRLKVPGWVRTVGVPSESNGRNVEYAVCQDVATLLYLANLGCIEMNPWNSRVESLDRPDYLVIDLDPVEVPFSTVIEAAVAVRKVLEKVGAEGVCKSSGKRGLHVFVPLAAGYTHDQARQFAELIAHHVHHHLPDTTSLVRSPALRRGRVYLDYLQNRRGQTLAAAYSVRPHAGATVSTPLTWREVRKGLNPAVFTIKTIHRRLDRLGDLWKPVLGRGVNLADSLRRSERLAPKQGRST
jgi:bifunctional non-homologous end joining protein LigD